MKPGSVIIDVAIDQGGCVETSRPTTHSEPTYMVDEVLHYCVTNMPGAVGRTSTYALCNVTLPWALAIANRGIERAAAELRPLASSINIMAGEVTNEPVAADVWPAVQQAVRQGLKRAARRDGFEGLTKPQRRGRQSPAVLSELFRSHAPTRTMCCPRDTGARRPGPAGCRRRQPRRARALHPNDRSRATSRRFPRAMRTPQSITGSKCPRKGAMVTHWRSTIDSLRRVPALWCPIGSIVPRNCS